MRTTTGRLGSALLSVAMVTSTLGAAPAVAQEAPPDAQVLVFSRTESYRHDSIPAGIAAIEQLGAEHGFGVDATEEATDFTEENLARYDAVIWLSTTGDVLDEPQQAAFEAYIKGGGGYVGIHAASDTEYDWPWYGELVGAYFDTHPDQQTATIDVTDDVHPSTAHLPTQWERFDEWYNFQENARGDVHVLASLDESTYDAGGGAMGTDHPIAWCQDFEGGRSWYTAGGHTTESYAEPAFLEHLLGGIETAAGWVPADCGATVWDNYETTKLMGDIGEPIGMATLPDGRVLTTARSGEVYLWDPEANQRRLAGDIPVYSHDEDGLQGVAVDPNFAENGWVYVYYAPPLDTPSGAAPDDGDPEDFEPFVGANHLSRFQLEGNTLDLDSEQVLLEVEQSRGICCHNGGDLDFDAEGNLYLSTGDDTSPFQSSGYTPIDERPTRNPAYDAQRTSANTNDLRGKLLRIRPQADGSYTVPEGNLFAGDGDDRTRDEIYAMGFRNPFRFSVDPETGWVYLGDYGPDAGSADPQRGPAGQVEFNVIREAGNFGWPYCHGDNDAYVDHDFATNTSGETFDCEAPVNDSPRNDGLTQLPPAQPAWIAYDGGSVPEFGTGGESPMGGPVYRYDETLESDTKFPEAFDGTFFAYEWDRSWIKAIEVGEDGAPVAIEPFAPSDPIVRPMDVEFGPDGSMYVLDYGSGYFSGSPEAGLYRIDYVKGTRSPIARATATPRDGQAPLEVQFSAAGSVDPDGDAITYAWDFQSDGTIDATDRDPTFTYTENGTYNAQLTVTDETDATGVANVTITVGNTSPEVRFDAPVEGGFFDFGDQVAFDLSVTDAEEETVDCEQVAVEFVLGHDNHGHPLNTVHGCEGVIQTLADEGHDASSNVFGVLAATYTDTGGEGVGPLTGEAEIIINPKRLQAEHHDAMSGVQVVEASGAAGGARVGYIDDGDWIAYDPVNLTGIDGVTLRTSSGGSGGTLELRWDAVDGPLLGSTEVPSTGSWDTYQTLPTIPLEDAPTETGRLYLVFSGGFDVDQVSFEGKGISDNARPSVEVTATPTSGLAPLGVDFDATVSDPEGDELTYAWDFGVEGATADTPDATYTYTEPGRYAATLTVTDARGAVTEARVTIDVVGPLPPCPTPGSDAFDGATLDAERWHVVREDPDGYRVADGALTIDTSRSDMYGGRTDGQNLVLQDAPDGIWRARTLVTIDHEEPYQQAGLLVYDSDQNFTKAAFITTPDGRSFEFIQQRDGAVDDGGEIDRSPTLPEDFPGSVYLEIASDGDTLTAAYSVDGQEWIPLGRERSLEGMEDPQVGLFALNGGGTDAEVPATFEQFDLVTPSDPFDGDDLVRCRWTTIVREEPGGYSVADGALHVDTGDGTDMYGGNTTAENLILQPVPTGGWQATTEVTLDLGEKTYEQASLLVYGDDDDFVKLSLIKVPDGRNLEFIRQQDGEPVDGGEVDRTPLLPAEFPDTVHLRITSDGTDLRAAYSTDGENFTEFGRARSLAGIPDPHVGVTAFNGDGDGDVASFSSFTLEPAPEADPVVCDEPVEADAGHRMLFDRTAASLEGWAQAGPGSFELTDDCTIESVGGMGLFFFDEEFAAPYTLKLDWLIDEDENSGVFVGFPHPGDDPWVAVEGGEEIQIDPTDDPDSTTGAVYDEQAADAAAVESAINPEGEWNTFEIEVTETQIRVHLNGVLINEYTDDDPNVDLSSGYIGLQNHGPADSVAFRDVQIAEGTLGGGPACPDPEVERTVSDEFDGDALDGCRWDRVVRYDPELVEVADGVLTLHTGEGDVYAGDNFGPRGGPANLILQSAPDEDWTIETRMDPSFDEQYQQGGLMAYLDDDNYVKFDLVTDNPAGEPLDQRLELRSEVGGEIVGEQVNVEVDRSGPWWLRLTRSGDDYTAAYSEDGEVWTDFPATVTNSVVGGEAFGLYTLGWSQQASKPAEFTHFHLVGEASEDVTSPTVEASLEGSTDDDGAYTGPVTVTLDASDEEGGSGVGSVEYALDGGALVVYDEPFTVEAVGDHTVMYRATDLAGNVSEHRQVSFTIVEVTEPTPPVADAGGPYEVERGDELTLDASGSSVGDGAELVGYEWDLTPLGLDDASGEQVTVVPETAGEFEVTLTVTDDRGRTATDTATVEVDVPVEVTEPTPPVADAGGPYEVERGDELTLDASGSSVGDGAELVGYEWDLTPLGLDDASGEQVTVVPETAGEFEVTLTVTDDRGRTATDTATVEVDVSGVPAPVPPPTVCERVSAVPSFGDARGNFHAAAIACLEAYGLAFGSKSGAYRPSQHVTRDQMASFLQRLLAAAGVALPAAPADRFADDDGSVHEGAIDQLAAVGVIEGKGGARYAPREPVTRAQMASLLVRAVELATGERLPAPASPFTDIGPPHAGAIDAAYAAGITQGKTATTFDPQSALRRDQMASLLVGTMQILAEAGLIEPLE